MSYMNQKRRKRSSGPRFAKQRNFPLGKMIGGLVTLTAAVLSCWLTVQLLFPVSTSSGLSGTTSQTAGKNTAIMDRYDNYINNSLSEALVGLEGFERPKKTYWLTDDVIVAPEPNPECWGTTKDPKSLQWLLDAAEETLGITDTLFSTDVEIYAGSEITYYLDETIFSITWKQVFHNCIYTISEVKIAHGSQLRRFLADGTYGSDKQYYPSEMAITVNAVTASSGDFYKFRSWGVGVYQGKVMTVKTITDTCFIDDNGDLIFSWAGEFADEASAQAFVDENNIRFSLLFGPILVVDGKNVVPDDYDLGEINKGYARMALCQMDERHYLMVAANQEANSYTGVPTAKIFADQLITFGVDKAYSLDGGQTAAIISNDRLINRPTYGTQRQISDIIYFATAIPDGE